MACFTLTLLPQLQFVVPLPLPPPPPGPDKAERDDYGLPNASISENFALRWGDSADISEADIVRVMDSLEHSWSLEIETLGMPAPYGSEDWLFNVYIGDTGDGAPAVGGVYGYYSTDGQGWPMVVLSQDAVSASSETLTTIPHEFFHALQDAAGTYAYSGDSAWWWEATATWMESVAYPDDPNYAIFLFGFAFLPHYPLSFFDYYDTGSFQELYQYGAFIFPRFIAEQVADPETIIDTWLDPRGHTEPLAPLGEMLAEQGIELEEVIASFSAHNAVWDYVDGSTYDWYLSYYDDFPEYAAYDHRIAVEVDPGGTDGWALPPAETLPGRYGYNVLRLAEPADSSLWISVEGDQVGSEGTPARWAVTVIEDGPTYQTIPITEGAGSLALSELSGEVLIVVTALADAASDEEVFEYRYAVDTQPPGALDTGDTGGASAPESRCGCRGGAGAIWLLPLYGSLRSWRRKTMTPSPSAKCSS